MPQRHVPAFARVLALLLAAAAVPAQDAPLLQLATGDPTIAFGLSRLVGADATPLRPGPREHAEFVLGADLVLQSRVAAEPMPGDDHTVLVVRPAAWLQAAAVPVQALLKQGRPRLDAILRNFGLAAGAGSRIVDDLHAFAGGIERFELRLRGGSGTDWQGSAVITPLRGSAFADWVGKLAPAKDGAPALPRTAEPAWSMQLALAPESMDSTFEPLLPWLVAFYGKADAEQAATTTALMRRSLHGFDGRMTMAMAGAVGAMQMTMGTRDGKAMAELAKDPAMLALNQQLLERQRMSAEIKPDAFTHRGVSVLRTTVVPDRPNPYLPADGMTTYGGLAGDTWISVSGGADAEARMRAALDAGLDGKLPHPLPTVVDDPRLAALLRVDFDLAAMTALTGRSGATMPPGAPARMALSAHKSASGIELRFLAK